MLLHVHKWLLAEWTLIFVLGKLTKTVLMHSVTALQINWRGLASKKIVFLANRTRMIKCLLHMSMILQGDWKYARVALIAVSEVFSTSLATKSTAVTMKVLLCQSLCVKKHTFATKIISEPNPTILTTLGSLISLIKQLAQDLQVELARTRCIWCLGQLRTCVVCRISFTFDTHWVFFNRDKAGSWSSASINCRTLRIWQCSDCRVGPPAFLNYLVGWGRVWYFDLS